MLSNSSQSPVPRCVHAECYQTMQDQAGETYQPHHTRNAHYSVLFVVHWEQMQIGWHVTDTPVTQASSGVMHLA